MEAMVKERERNRMEEQKAKWTRREENEFLRVVSTYGVNYDRKKAQYDWTKFKSIARFDKKTDADLTDYYMSFRALCKKICNTKSNEDDGLYNDVFARRLIFYSPSILFGPRYNEIFLVSRSFRHSNGTHDAEQGETNSRPCRSPEQDTRGNSLASTSRGETLAVSAVG